MGFKLWAILISVSLILGSVTWYVASAEGAKADRKALKAQAKEDALTIFSRDTEIKALNERIKANNAEKLVQLEAEKARVAEAKRSAEELKLQRDTIARELAASRKAWAEAVKNDATLREWIVDISPPPVWERLRIAAGQTSQ